MVNGESRDYLGAAWSRSQASFFVGVALVPALLAQLVRGLEEHFSWLSLAVPLAMGTALAFSLAWLRSRREGRPIFVDDSGSAGIRLDSVEILAATVDLSRPAAQDKSLHLLIRNLPRLREVHLIMGPCSPEQERVNATTFADWLIAVGRSNVVVGQTRSIESLSLTTVGMARLDSMLAGLPDNTVVDVTGGTVAMSLAAHEAARKRGLTTTYTEATFDTPRRFVRLTDITGPEPVDVPASGSDGSA